MNRRHPQATRTDTPFPYTTLFRSNVSQLGLVIRPGPADPETNAFHAVVGKHREDIHTVAGEHEMWVGSLLHQAGKAEKVGEVVLGRREGHGDGGHRAPALHFEPALGHQAQRVRYTVTDRP